MTTESIPTTEIRDDRRAAVLAALTDIRQIAQTPIDRSTLAAIAGRLEKLAQEKQLFPATEFPPPAASAGSDTGASVRYRLNCEDGDGDIALYVNAINPGKKTIPHNHDTWAVVVAIDGVEDNRVYRRTDKGEDPDIVRLEFDRDVAVRPGTSIAFLPDDFHSIAVTGETPTLHFHLYGRPLETLVNRLGVDLETGAVEKYNGPRFKPSKVAS